MNYSDYQKLIRCHLARAGSAQQNRFIEFELFKLWQHMMQTKHGFAVSDLTMCLWVPVDEFNTRAKLYERIGAVDEVTRLTITIFDERHGFTHVSHRYAEAAEANTVQGVLLSHIPDSVTQSQHFELTVSEGRTVEKGQVSGFSEISLGLSND